MCHARRAVPLPRPPFAGMPYLRHMPDITDTDGKFDEIMNERLVTE